MDQYKVCVSCSDGYVCFRFSSIEDSLVWITVCEHTQPHFHMEISGLRSVVVRKLSASRLDCLENYLFRSIGIRRPCVTWQDVIDTPYASLTYMRRSVGLSMPSIPEE